MDFAVRADETCAQYTLRAHPEFWVRVDLPTTTQLTISAAYQGDLTDRAFSEAMSEVLRKHAGGNVVRIRFADIASRPAMDMNDKQGVARRFDLLSDLVGAWATCAGREILDRHLDIGTGTYSAVFRLACQA
jgi:hypothetical protein